MLSVPLLISPAAAWTSPTHQTIATQIYHSLPLSVQHKLNLNEMKKGSIAPDVVFKDSYQHMYPKSAAPAQLWLNRGKAAYKAKNYNYASYCFGVASHYIADSFSAPHCSSLDTGAQHIAYEAQTTNMIPSIKYRSGSLNSLLSAGKNQGAADMKTWLKNKSRSIVQKDLNSGASAAYSLIRNCV